MFWTKQTRENGVKHLTLMSFVVGLAVVGACSRTATQGQPVGSEISGGVFGTATTNNMMIQTGQRQYTSDLANRFAAEVLSTVNFGFNSARLDAQAIATLQQQANWIKQFPEVQFRVYGHTDLVGSNAYNKRLGLRRARAVVNYFASQGIDRSRLEAVVSFGETQPLVVTQGRERANRRTVTEVNGFVQGHPMVLDGQYAQIIYRDYVQSAATTTELSGVDLPGGG